MALTDDIIAGWKFNELTGNFASVAGVPTSGDFELTNVGASHGVVGKFGTGIGTGPGAVAVTGDITHTAPGGHYGLYWGGIERTDLEFGNSYLGETWSISAWVNPATVPSPQSYGVMWSIGDLNTGSSGALISLQGSTLVLQVTNGPATFIGFDVSSFALGDGNYHHIVVTYDYNTDGPLSGIKGNLVVDGDVNHTVYSLMDFGSDEGFDGPSYQQLGEIAIGDYYDHNCCGNFNGLVGPAGLTFEGKIDEVFIWKRVLSNTEITDLWNGGAGVNLFGAPPVVAIRGIRGWTPDPIALPAGQHKVHVEHYPLTGVQDLYVDNTYTATRVVALKSTDDLGYRQEFTMKGTGDGIMHVDNIHNIREE